MKNSLYELTLLTFLVPIIKFTFATKNGNQKGQNQANFWQKNGGRAKAWSAFSYTVKLRVEARVTIQKIKSLGVLQIKTCH